MPTLSNGQDTADLGARGERWALRHLYEQGYDVLERNYRCRLGEIDLIGYDGPILAFIEVKTRTSGGPELPGEALDSKQEQRVRDAAALYRRSRHLEHLSYRFDLVAIEVGPSGNRNIKLIRDAF